MKDINKIHEYIAEKPLIFHYVLSNNIKIVSAAAELIFNCIESACVLDIDTIVADGKLLKIVS